ncbi:hypothetical protein JQ616_35750 [Bradyrhizobium tropiciagri]|uniref:hypothetical protein n=1 Tax=Bradyrhizobium tropiciagri TaxID=312253 RepID=UPI001BA886CA|nr:hypothetical protein [Bradyrhizobium tropiciagri]MBR0900335.1 hypothetical protein [Bradyrhizobium tropiciagri]
MTKSDMSTVGPASVGLACPLKQPPGNFKRLAFFNVIAVPAPWLEWEGGRDRDVRQ